MRLHVMRSRETPESRRRAARPGIGIIECLILIVILGVSIAAILSTMEWGSRSYAFAREDLDRRVLLFNWFQAFESFYPGIANDFADACEQTTDFLGGQWRATSLSPPTGEVVVKGMRFQVRETANGGGIMIMNVTVYPSQRERSELVFSKRFNVFSSETVSDDVI
jgi:hypothetical protein